MIYRQKPRKSKTTKAASKRKTNMKNFIRGFFFCAMWYLSIIAGFFLLVCPILPLAIISPKRYRKWSDIIFGMWEPFPVAMMEVCFGIRVVLSGDKINPFEGSLFVMNHRTRVDWNFLWLGLFHCCQPNAHNMKYILKAPIMHFPGPGWVMQTCSFIFVHRNWERDKPLLNDIIDYLNESDSLYQILLFPEGTDLTERNIIKSNQYAEENNLEKYYKVLHPRTTGFTFIASKMKTGGQLKAVYDVTIAYPKSIALTEADLLRGKFPEEVHFNVKRHSSENIPYHEEELKTWLNKIWKEKERKLQQFYEKGSFTDVEGEDAVYNLSDKDIDFGKMSIKNGVIKYDVTDAASTSVREVSLASTPRRRVSGQSGKTSASITVYEPLSTVNVKSDFTPLVDVESDSEPLVDVKSEYEPLVDVKSESEPLVHVKSENEPLVPVESENEPLVHVKSENEPVVDVKSENESLVYVKSENETLMDIKSEFTSLIHANSEFTPLVNASSGGEPSVDVQSQSTVFVNAKSPPRSAISSEKQISAKTSPASNSEDSTSKGYRPSHILYLVLVFWLTLIILTIHQLCYNTYLQIWVLTHSLLFIALSFVSNGFHHLAASVYFYRVGRNQCLIKKLE